MQKTEIKYYCDKCGNEITSGLFTFAFTYSFYALKQEQWNRTVYENDELKHYCRSCAKPIIHALGLEMEETVNILEETRNA